jgi:hypothetical protein
LVAERTDAGLKQADLALKQMDEQLSLINLTRMPASTTKAY